MCQHLHLVHYCFSLGTIVYKTRCSVQTRQGSGEPGGGERTPSVLGMLQRNKQRDVRHLFQHARGEQVNRAPPGEKHAALFSCSPFANEYSAPMLEYIDSAFDAYSDVPLFAHVHSIAAHDKPTLQKRRAFDHLLGPWLDKLLSKHPNTAVITLGDHGPHKALDPKYSLASDAVASRDKNNKGHSYIIGLGNYTGGELVFTDKSSPNYGTHNIKNKW
eukprot:SAG11_NODE_12498_length_699_cov_0.703827_1_plen_216_part_01